jgi:hypothetical protein
VAPYILVEMASESVTWMLPYMVLEFAYVYALIIAWASLFGYFKFKTPKKLVRDFLIILLVICSARFGLVTGHSVVGLIGMGLGCIISLAVHSSEFRKTNDMAPFGHLTVISLLTSLLAVSGMLTSELW